MKKKALVIGGSGFMGSHTSDKLSEAGYQTSIFDLIKSPWLRNDQKMIIGDIEDISSVSEAIKDADIVYNFAALADLSKALDQPKKTAKINIIGNLNVLEACKKFNIERFIYASTVYVHSREGGYYRCSKQASEHYVEEYNRTYGLNYTILRYGSLYGPRADESNGLLKIIKNAIETGKLIYHGHPDSMREYIHVEDAAEASLLALEKDFINKSVVLTGQEPMKVFDVLKMIGEMLGMPEDSVEFIEGENIGHYVRTPYAYKPKLSKKFTPNIHIDFGQGLLDLINSIKDR